MTPEQQFLTLAEAISKVEDKTRQAQLMQAFFGRGSKELLPLIMDLSDKIDISRAMLYRNIKELEEAGLIEELKLTDAGKIARL